MPYVLMFCFFAGCSPQGDLQNIKLSEVEKGDEIVALDMENVDLIDDAEVVYKNVGSVDSFSGLSSEVARLLLENEIDCMITGSREHSIAVPPNRAEESRLILQKWRDENDKNIFVVGAEVTFD